MDWLRLLQPHGAHTNAPLPQNRALHPPFSVLSRSCAVVSIMCHSASSLLCRVMNSSNVSLPVTSASVCA